MQTFVRNFIVPVLAEHGLTRVCEIGASRGSSSQLLASLPSGSLTVIDPCLDLDLEKKFSGAAQVTVRKGISLEVLPRLDDAFDCILIDGDHNWYTVYHELKIVYERELLRRGGIVFFHDIEWPWGRRDLYYQPETIPAAARHPWSQRGVVQGRSGLSDRGGFYSGGTPRAAHEGGARNGVLTAIEDFLLEHKGEYEFLHLTGDSGLGIMYRLDNSTEDRKILSIKRKARMHNFLTYPKALAKAAYHRAGKQIL